MKPGAEVFTPDEHNGTVQSLSGNLAMVHWQESVTMPNGEEKVGQQYETEELVALNDI